MFRVGVLRGQNDMKCKGLDQILVDEYFILLKYIDIFFWIIFGKFQGRRIKLQFNKSVSKACSGNSLNHLF